MKPIVLYGMPRPQGGANTESAATCLLWRSMGIPVTILPAGPEPPDNPWPARLAAAGCKIMPEIKPDDLVRQPWLFRSIVVDFACERAVRNWDRLACMNCQLIHVPCHCFTMHHEEEAFRHRPPTVVMFQSEYQRWCLSLQYAAWGVPEERQRLIHGAFDPSAFPFDPRPHIAGTPFRVGRLARDVPAKWPPKLWKIIDAASEQIPLQGDCMGWADHLIPHSGKPPVNVFTRLPGSMPTSEYLANLHALLCVNEPDLPENWPRIGLEAMSAGVPIIADNVGGWREMIVHGETGLLCDSSAEAVAALVELAREEAFRMKLVTQARESLATLADPKIIGRAWQKIFCELSGNCSC
jgi:hypothetical protein